MLQGKANCVQCVLAVIIFRRVCRGMTSEEATRLILEEQIPRLKREVENGTLQVDSIDVFCEKVRFLTTNQERSWAGCPDK